MPSSLNIILFTRKEILRLLFGDFTGHNYRRGWLSHCYTQSPASQSPPLRSQCRGEGQELGWEVSQCSSSLSACLLFLISSPSLKQSGNPLKSHFTSITKSYPSLRDFQGFSKLPVKNQEQRLDLFIFAIL